MVGTMARGAAHSVVGGHHRIEEQLPPERYSFSCQRIVGGNGRDQVETERSRSTIPVNRVTADENGERSNGERGAAHDQGQRLCVSSRELEIRRFFALGHPAIVER